MSSITDTIYDAQRNCHEIPLVSETHGSFDIDRAYLYQDELIERYLSEGMQIAGYKIALASRVKMEQMGVDSPLYGIIFKEMNLTDFKVNYSKLIHPKAEPEIAVKMSEDVPPDASESEVEACIGFVAPAIEIIDSRFKDFKFTATNCVADNSSSAQFALGEWLPYEPERMRLDDIGASLIINGEEAASGKSSAVLGSPVTALYELNKSLTAHGKGLLKDQTVLTGAITAAHDIRPGDTVVNSTDTLGELTLR